MPLESLDISLNDFPDEILLLIFRWLNSIDVLYSFHNLSSRFNRIVRDRIFCRHLNLVEKRCNIYHSRIRSNEILNRLCLEILPSIADQIEQLDLESSSMQAILNAAQYENLSQLSLYNLKREQIEWLFNDEKLSCETFPNRIRTLHIRIGEDDYDESCLRMIYICENLFRIFHSLINMELDESLMDVIGGLSFSENRLDHFRSSILLQLKINVQDFHDVLHLFDGHFSQLESVELHVAHLVHFGSIRNEGEIPHMKYFSICSPRETIFCNAFVSLLKRMTNLERLKTCLKVDICRGYVDSNYFYTHICCSLPKLNWLTFYIRSRRIFPNELDLSVLQALGEAFIVDGNVGIRAYGDYFHENRIAQYHFYSIPSFNEFFCGISNRFPGGKFPFVRRISLIDEQPFEDEFFSRISQSFPRIEKLSIVNSKGQNHRQSNDDQSNHSPIKYDHLRRLILVNIHDHYLEKFLLKSKSHFLHQITLHVRYQSLKRVTNNFTTDQMRFNCDKINRLYFCDQYEHSDHLQEYFPHGKISR